MTDQPNDNFTWLTHWYAAQCDGEWEHDYGVVIETLDNPGWLLKIDLTYTDLAGKPFETLVVNMPAPDGDPSTSWYHCKVEGELFQASGGAHDLETMLGVFRAWAEGQRH
jgi:hypothetical protein